MEYESERARIFLAHMALLSRLKLAARIEAYKTQSTTTWEHVKETTGWQPSLV